MLRLFTLYNKNNDSRYPLAAGIISGEGMLYYPLYTKFPPRSIYDVEHNIKTIADAISGEDVIINDYKRAIETYQLDHNLLGRTYDIDVPSIKYDDHKNCQQIVMAVLDKVKQIQPQLWQEIRAGAAVVYKYLQDKGVMYVGKREYPQWDWTTSGRSKNTGFNVQGLTANDYISNVNGDRIVLNFDWVAADIRAAAVMSGDQKLNRSFEVSDPYEYYCSAVRLADESIDRNEGKISFFRAIYSLQFEGPLMLFYSGFKDWLYKCLNELRSTGKLSSIVGRKFTIAACKGQDDDKNEKTVFNAMVQGSVASLMQICIRKVWDIFPGNILTENHDSLIMTCDSTSQASDIIKQVARIMVQPLASIETMDNPQFPVKVSIGRAYKNWKFYKRFNNASEI